MRRPHYKELYFEAMHAIKVMRDDELQAVLCLEYAQETFPKEFEENKPATNRTKG